MFNLSRPSYKQGFARSAGESAYPNLWVDLVGAWVPELGPTGKTLFDLSGFGSNGILTNMELGADWSVTERGYSLDYDGSSEYTEMADSEATSVTGNFSISSWSFSRTSGVTLPNQEFVTKGRTDGQRSYLTSIGGANGIIFYVTPDGTQANRAFRSSSPVTWPQDVWAHLCFTYTTSGSPKMRIYLNGLEVATNLTGVEPSSVHNSTETLRLASGINNPFDGRIGATYLYKKTLNPTEVLFLFQNPLAPFQLRQPVFKAPAVEIITVDKWFPGINLPHPEKVELINY